MNACRLAVLETHPVQYHAPVYRQLQQHAGINIKVIYASDFSVVGYRDAEFGKTIAWDVDLLSGYESCFLSRHPEDTVPDLGALSARGLDDALEAFRPTHVLLTGYNSLFHRQSRQRASRFGARLCLRSETTDHALARSPLKKLLRDSYLRRWYGSLDAAFYIGQYSREHYRRLKVPPEKLFFSPYCVGTSSFELSKQARGRLRTAVRAQLHIPEDRIVALFSGKLSRRKAPDVLLAAAAQLSGSQQKPIDIIFLGEGELKETLKARAQAQKFRAHFPGFQNQTQISSYYHASDVLVLPSLFGETWGLVVNEALHHGVPCVVSEAVGCAPDLVVPGKTGELFPAGSSQSLARALASVLRWRHARTSEHCRTHISRYTVEQAAKGLAQGLLARA